MKYKEIIKRNGSIVPYDKKFILNALMKANAQVNKNEKITTLQMKVIIEQIEKTLNKFKHMPSVEEIQDLVIFGLMNQNAYVLAKEYTEYRFKKNLTRQINTTDNAILSLLKQQNDELNKENSNKDASLNTTMRDYIAGEVNKDLLWRVEFETGATKYMPDRPLKAVKLAHESGSGHFHDGDYSLQSYHNCDVINLDDMLQNGTVISKTKIFKPKSLLTATNVSAQIIAQVSSSQYGGQTITLSHIAPFVDVSRRKIRKKVEKELKAACYHVTSDKVEKITEIRLKDEIKAAVQTLQHQLVTLQTTNGQTPFISIFMYLNEVEDEQTKHDLALLIEEILNQRIEGLPNEDGVFVTPAFPKLLYVLDDNNTYKGSEYFYLTELAAKCSAKRLVPDYISAKIMKKLKGVVYPCMGCRSFLTVDRFTDKNVGNIANALNYKPNEPKYYGRFNMGVYTVNLPFYALESKGNEKKFWELFEHHLEYEAHVALRWRYEHLKGTKSDVAPILWQHGALARLKKGETIDNLLINGYSTVSLGYAGLYECTKYMTGHSHTEPEGKEFAIKVMQFMNDHCTKWKLDENIDYSVYGTPLESTTYKFAKAIRNKFGVIKDITDHDYITNSYHVCVREEIDAFSKLSLEAEFQKLSPGGAISYVEVPNLQNNIDAVIKIIQHIYENIMYAEINSKSDYCSNCGFDGEIELIRDKNGKRIWHCPQCGNTNQDTMSVARRTCGYIGTNYWNDGRTEEIGDRVLHVN